MKIYHPRGISKYYYFKAEILSIRSREEFAQTLRSYVEHSFEISALLEEILPGTLLSDVLAIIIDPNKKFISALISGEFDYFNSFPAETSAREVVVTSNSRDITDICEFLQKMKMDNHADAEPLLTHENYSDPFLTLLHDLQTIDDATFNILKQTIEIKALNQKIQNQDRELSALKKEIIQSNGPDFLFENGFYYLLDQTSTFIYEQHIQEIVSELKEDCDLSYFGGPMDFVEKTINICKKEQMLPEHFNIQWQSTFDALLYFKAHYVDVYQLFLFHIARIYFWEVLDNADAIEYIAINYSQDKEYVLAKLVALLKDSDRFQRNVYNSYLFLPSDSFTTNFKRSIDEHIV